MIMNSATHSSSPLLRSSGDSQLTIPPRTHIIDLQEGGVSVIIESHAHYNNNAYKKPFRYLTHSESGYALKEGD